MQAAATLRYLEDIPRDGVNGGFPDSEQRDGDNLEQRALASESCARGIQLHEREKERTKFQKKCYVCNKWTIKYIFISGICKICGEMWYFHLKLKNWCHLQLFPFFWGIQGFFIHNIVT